MARRRDSKSLDSRQEQLLTELRAEFVAFRRTHPPRTRVPERLRMRALKAIDAGVGPTAVSRASGVTRTQLSRWRSGAGVAKRKERDGEGAQILSVVEAAGGPARPEDVELEVGMGSWRLSIRMQARGTQRR